MKHYYRSLNLLVMAFTAFIVCYVLIALGNPLAILGVYLIRPLFDPQEFEGEIIDDRGQQKPPEPEYGETSSMGFTAKL